VVQQGSYTYYIHNTGIYRIQDGASQAQLVAMIPNVLGQPSGLNIIGDMIYYQIRTEDRVLCGFSLSGDMDSEIQISNVDAFVAVENCLYTVERSDNTGDKEYKIVEYQNAEGTWNRYVLHEIESGNYKLSYCDNRLYLIHTGDSLTVQCLDFETEMWNTVVVMDTDGYRYLLVQITDQRIYYYRYPQMGTELTSWYYYDMQEMQHIKMMDMETEIDNCTITDDDIVYVVKCEVNEQEDGTAFRGDLNEIVKMTPEGKVMETYPISGDARTHLRGPLSITDSYLYFSDDNDGGDEVTGRIPINGKNTAQIAAWDIESKTSVWRSAN
ncbi:MAG: hypothetical protein LIO46_00175, partial [Clostridiales bacterium]|nr:hypothetical protein [Clostridiales bacterium]